MAFYTDEWNQILSGGEEFSEPVSLLYYGVTHQVNVTYSEGWSRKEVDGRLTTDDPLATKSIIIAKSAIPSSVLTSDYHHMEFMVEGSLYGVLNFTGKDPMIFYLTAKEFPPSEGTVVGDDDEELGSDEGDVGTVDPELAEDW